MSVKLLNLARSKLAVAVGANETQLQVLTGHGSRFPVLTSAGDWFPVVLENENGTIEICRATSRTGDVITVLRAQEGTDRTPFAAGDACELRLTVAALEGFGGGGGTDPVGGPLINVSSAVIEEV